jgi:hypothetical protein
LTISHDLRLALRSSILESFKLKYLPEFHPDDDPDTTRRDGMIVPDRDSNIGTLWTN